MCLRSLLRDLAALQILLVKCLIWSCVVQYLSKLNILLLEEWWRYLTWVLGGSVWAMSWSHQANERIILQLNTNKHVHTHKHMGCREVLFIGPWCLLWYCCTVRFGFFFNLFYRNWRMNLVNRFRANIMSHKRSRWNEYWINWSSFSSKKEKRERKWCVCLPK